MTKKTAKPIKNSKKLSTVKPLAATRVTKRLPLYKNLKPMLTAKIVE